MRVIPLTRGQVAIVDDEDYEYLNQFKWHAYKGCSTYYANRALPRNGKAQKSIRMHRELLNISDPQIRVDHKDHNGLNNQKANIRQATASQNAANRTTRGTSKYLGVAFHKKNKSWVAVAGIKGKLFHLGSFKTEEEAALAYNKKALEIHGEFANLNKVGIWSAIA